MTSVTCLLWILQEYHIKRLEKSLDLEGCISLQNGLELALDSLKTVPAHGHREVVCLVAALNTCDPGNIHQSIKGLQVKSCIWFEVFVSFVNLHASIKWVMVKPVHAVS